MDKFALPTTEDTEKMMRLPVGFASPLWLMFAGAATVGAAWYWSRTLFRPTNLEALAETTEAVIEAVDDEVEDLAEATLELAEEVAESAIDMAVEVAEEALDAATEVADEVLEAAPEPVQEIFVAMAFEPVAPPAAPDDLTRLTGIGPKLAAALAEQGVTRFADIAAWTADDVARFDKALKLMGRVEREAWIAQARRLAEA